ncbi:tudor domain-containing protein 3 [Branchiostoma belcheri]|nr:tudor domain-containing protein 3 [Branchiostoma belcheri]
MAAEAAVLWKQGWHLSAEGIATLKQENNITTIDGIVRKALDEDLKSIGEKFLPEDISRGGSSELIGPCVLQVTKVRNVSAPKANEESGHAPRMLKVQMTDGHTTCIGLEVAQVQQLSLSTPPGTKVKLTGSIPISNGFLMLEGSNVKKLAHHSRANVKVEGGAPPFVPFGQRVSSGAVATKDLRYKKSLPKKETESEEADEFSEQRKAVIAEVSKSKEGTKTFGGTGSLPATAIPEKKWGGPADRRGDNRAQGVYRELSNESSQVEEKSVQKLLEMGFSRQDAVGSLRQSSGDVQEAINTLVNSQGQGPSQGHGRQGTGHRGQREDRGRATLFDFILESKIDNLKIDDSKAVPGAQNSQPPRYNRPQGGRDQRENHYDGQGWPQVGDSQFYGHRNQNNEYRGQRNPPGGRQQYDQHSREGGHHFNDSRPYDSGRGGRGGRDNYRDTRRGGGEQGNRPGTREQRGGKTENQEFRGQNDSYRDHRRQQDGNPRRQERNLNENFNQNQRDNSQLQRGDRTDPRQHQDQGSRYESRRTNNRQGSYEDRGGGGGQRQGGQERTNQPRNAGEGSQRKWRRNDHCLARYWEDGKFYPAMVTDVAPNGRTAVVLFSEYDNYEEVEMFNIRPTHGGGWMDSSDPASAGTAPSGDQKYEPYQGDINTTLEFHRSSDRRRPPADRAQSAPTHGRGPREPKKPTRPALPIYQPPAKKKQSPE